jgi:hypothetical protein
VILKPLRSKRRTQLITAYDLEWIPGTLQTRVAAAYDERGYRWYPTVDQFLAAELTYQNSKRWYYAHAGGMADVQFILERAIAHRIQFEAAFANSSAIIVKLIRDRYRWTFADSYHLFNRPLQEIAEWSGASKTEVTAMSEPEKIEWYRSAPLRDLVEYNRVDCEILYNAIQEYQLTLLEIGGQLRLTQASCAMDLFRRKYLDREIEVSPEINLKARDAYFASRVEVFAPRCDGAKYYDINSSFPAAMLEPLPGSAISVGRRPKTDMYLADVEIEIKECYLPPTPARVDGRLFFPTGQWRTWLSSIDIRLLEEQGHRILRIHEAIDFEPFSDLAAYASDLYEMRRKETATFPRQTYKLLMNSLYGKFGESSEKTKALFDPPAHVIRELRRQKIEPVLPGLWIAPEHRDIVHAHVPIATWITSIARRALFRPMSRANELYYCDTDGFATDTEHATSDRLGGLKLEKRSVRGRFLSPKLYRLEGLDVDGNRIEIVAGKGFSRLDTEGFTTLENSLDHPIEDREGIVVRRITRLRGLWRGGEIKPREIVITKRLLNAKPKRAPVGSNTRPWSIAELAKD